MTFFVVSWNCVSVLKEILGSDTKESHEIVLTLRIMLKILKLERSGRQKIPTNAQIDCCQC